VAADVPQALIEIGDASDGFLVISAMRHLQPHCVDVILTGYPAYETALQAIRGQVDATSLNPLR